MYHRTCPYQATGCRDITRLKTYIELSFPLPILYTIIFHPPSLPNYHLIPSICHQTLPLLPNTTNHIPSTMSGFFRFDIFKQQRQGSFDSVKSPNSPSCKSPSAGPSRSQSIQSEHAAVEAIPGTFLYPFSLHRDQHMLTS